MTAGARARTFATAAYCLIPPLLCFVIYKRGLTAWFQADDFAWLKFALGIYDWRSFLDAFFAPRAQGTMRVLLSLIHI